MEKSEHFGVYGLVFNTDNSKILLVKKTRGPYTNLYDLPGGTPEAGESYIQTLYREFLEEVGAKPVKISDWLVLDFFVIKNSAGEAIDFHHKAVACKCKIDEKAPALGSCLRRHTVHPVHKAKNIIDEDVSGAHWIDVNETGRMSNLVLEVLKSIV